MTLELPAPFDTAERGAWTSYGRRTLTLTVSQPGSFARNAYSWLWVTIEERQPWKGEPLWVSGERRPPEAHLARTRLTDKAYDELSALLKPLVQRYGFSRAWLETYQAKATKIADAAVAAATRAQREVAWWHHTEELARMMADDVLDFVPIPEPPLGQRPVASIPRLYEHQQPQYEQPAAEARLNGELVGYMTAQGNLLPLRSVLDPPTS